MSQITLYLDPPTQALLEARAKACGMSKSRWVAELIRQHAQHEWPKECLDLAGRFADFPLRDEMPGSPAEDLPRISF